MNKRGRVVGEFLLIVVGVLVALAVETALDERQNDQLRDEYIERIQSEISVDKQAIEYRIEFFSSVAQFSLDTLNWLSSSTRLLLAPVSNQSQGSSPAAYPSKSC